MTEFQPLISVVIPAYNAASTIKRCLRSILCISNCKYEVIVIDDGSQDSTVEMCKSFENDRIRIISQENQGVSSARNRGIKEAKGQFILFVDADDLICARELEEVIKKLEPNDQLILFNILRNSNGILKRDKEPLKTGVYGEEGLEYLKRRILDVPVYKKWNNNCFQGSACCYLFKREMLLEKHIFFNKDLPYSEDLCFCLDVFNKFDKIKFLNKYVYIINSTENSASRRYREFFWNELQKVYREIVKLSGEKNEYIYYYYGKGAIHHYILYCKIAVACKKVKLIINDEEFNKSLKTIKFNKKNLDEVIEDFLILNKMGNVLVCYKKVYFKIMKMGSHMKRIIKIGLHKEVN